MKIEKIKKLANDLLLEPDNEVVQLTRKLLASIDKSLQELEWIDLENIKPLSHINEKEVDFECLRDDEINLDSTIKKSDLLANAASHDENLVIMKRVVNEE
ncbi:Glutamyl-tRNA (Gln) amidotransferase subunit C [Metamycoplasma auris 15026]|uniref:Glutamyl-tRNA (Gln) amidotransferase subunit C n=1 Tax=Metamycoplasma auris 15026 TaxID=1188233 RepID=N9VD49_9BACT|nr:glutamyl-tRNA(Gln) amidotransferase subunit C [Metamycoplasma auris]ENY69336.1 Glutamyl-tRNA (Gln) amidotransferase subunit C [Metamycoplasma auris 15026]